METESKVFVPGVNKIHGSWYTPQHVLQVVKLLEMTRTVQAISSSSQLGSNHDTPKVCQPNRLVGGGGKEI